MAAAKSKSTTVFVGRSFSAWRRQSTTSLYRATSLHVSASIASTASCNNRDMGFLSREVFFPAVAYLHEPPPQPFALRAMVLSATALGFVRTGRDDVCMCVRLFVASAQANSQRRCRTL